MTRVGMLVALALLILAGCGGTHKPLAQQVEQHGDTLYLPDGSSIQLSITDAAGNACPVVDEPSGLGTLDVADTSALGWSVTVDGC